MNFRLGALNAHLWLTGILLPTLRQGRGDLRSVAAFVWFIVLCLLFLPLAPIFLPGQWLQDEVADRWPGNTLAQGVRFCIELAWAVLVVAAEVCLYSHLRHRRI